MPFSAEHVPLLWRKMLFFIKVEKKFFFKGINIDEVQWIKAVQLYSDRCSVVASQSEKSR